MYAVVARHNPMAAGIGDHGYCPECECGGRERPCWFCGNTEGFTMGDGHILLPSMVLG